MRLFRATTRSVLPDFGHLWFCVFSSSSVKTHLAAASTGSRARCKSDRVWAFGVRSAFATNTEDVSHSAHTAQVPVTHLCVRHRTSAVRPDFARFHGFRPTVGKRDCSKPLLRQRIARGDAFGESFGLTLHAAHSCTSSLYASCFMLVTYRLLSYLFLCSATPACSVASVVHA